MTAEAAAAAAPALARRQQRLEALAASALRALVGVAPPALAGGTRPVDPRELHFRGARLHAGRRRLPGFAPHLHPRIDRDDDASWRGAADGLAARLRHSDLAWHRAQAPADAVERALFDLLEQFRAESLAAAQWTGVRRNLRHRFEAWSLQFHHDGRTDTDAGLLVYTLAQVARAQVCGEPVVEATEDLLETTRGALAPLIGHELAALRRHRHDQAAYAGPALRIAARMARALRDAAAGAPAPAGASTGDDDRDGEQDERTAFGFDFEPDEADDGDAAAGDAVQPGDRSAIGAGAPPYRVFTTAYDREADAAAGLREAELKALRDELDREIAARPFHLQRLARALHQALSRHDDRQWRDAQEQGRIDGRRLAQLIATPTERDLFRDEWPMPRCDVALTLLIDCSGSMKAHAPAVAALADSLARAAQLAGIATEVLGYTTGAWNGGRAARDWKRAGSPAAPGRLNERLHLVFKDAATPWGRARRGIATLLKGDRYRESLDGEALPWAAARLMAQDAERRVLLAISDGCPMDAATLSANGRPGRALLDAHLMAEAGRIESGGAIELHAVGVGLDLSPFYSSALALDPAAGLGQRTLMEIVALLAGRTGRR